MRWSSPAATPCPNSPRTPTSPSTGRCSDNLGIARGRRVALHPFLKTVVRECIPTDDKAVVDGNFYTAQTENTLSELMPRVLQALK